ncbi:MAG TPA: type II toxin-antitoxin system RelE/ParE family toxin [Bryobacteraceae bacterium]|jgi:plasmid stabilization system protein ParE|nr:type II toxin-antitoxin system RelE/ParE family toxin [Bryobacteraceae bacterium]
MSGYVLSADAGLDLEDIWEYIAGDSIAQADRWIGRLFDAFESIARSPGIGHRRTDLTEWDVLFWPVGNYVIVYRVARDRVEIVAVTQGARDIPAFLGRRLR